MSAIATIEVYDDDTIAAWDEEGNYVETDEFSLNLKVIDVINFLKE